MPAFMQVKERIPAAAAAQRCEPQGFMHRMRFTYEARRWLRITIFVVIAAVCAAFFYAFNLQTALIADDYNYRFIFGTANQRVEHIFDIIESMRAHYHTMNGRLILHSLTQLFLLWGKPVFNVVNTVGYLLFTGLIYWHCKGTGRHSPALYFGVHLMVWFFIPVYGQTMLWVDGSANYMWGSILRLAALLPLRLHVQAARPAAGSWWWLLLSIPAGVIAGWTNENSGAAFLVIVGLFLLYNRANKGRIPRWAVGMLAGAAVGFAVMIAARATMCASKITLACLSRRSRGFGMALPFATASFFITCSPCLPFMLCALPCCISLARRASGKSARGCCSAGSICLARWQGFMLCCLCRIFQPGRHLDRLHAQLSLQGRCTPEFAWIKQRRG